MNKDMFLSNEIHPTAIIGPDVVMGSGNWVGPYCYITGLTEIGDNNRFEAYVSIGTPAEHREHFEDEGAGVVIGSGCVLREFTTVNCGTENKTYLGDGVIMLRGSHVGHDSIIDDHVQLSCNVLIGGHSEVGEGANFGLGSMCHQHSLIGAYAFIGMNSCVTKSTEVQPGNIYVGNPAKFLKANTIGLERAGITQDQLAKLTIDWIYSGGQEKID
jgi:UDP-N-acetylglucosamine acyltransferase